MSENTGFPASAIERLNGMRPDAGGGAMTTSDLSIDEHLLITRAGFRPLGLCLGSCFYHVGYQYGKLMQNMELTVLSQAMYNARELAMSRMRAEARAMGADGIVGVRLLVQRVGWDAEVLEFIAIGTGVVHTSDTAGFKAPDGLPFTCHLSGQDFWKMLHTGMRPVAMVMGSCVYHIAHRGMMQTLASAGRNVELMNFTQATYDARETAMMRMQAEARTAKAESVVAVNLSETSHMWESHVTEFFAIGTAVIASGQSATADAPQLVLPRQHLIIEDTVEWACSRARWNSSRQNTAAF